MAKLSTEDLRQYPVIVAWGWYWGSPVEYIRRQINLARLDGAPGDVYEKQPAADWETHPQHKRGSLSDGDLYYIGKEDRVWSRWRPDTMLPYTSDGVERRLARVREAAAAQS
ncbi:hypothetical protein [Micromonospora maritima]|uniref:hypothetical protein n=1 Tax=Micromonospora maritima TaxID=986711 RepID=UPI00157E1D9B|nr:hypothetical protein [Micromonospora maritima]